MQVCFCGDKNYNEIIESIKDGNDTIDKLMDNLNVCTGCGCCRIVIEEIIEGNF